MSTASSLVLPVNEKDHIRGPQTASVTLVEYGDYQCPVCRLANPVLQRLLESLNGEMRFVFRHFPLQQAHPYALMAAKTAEAAGKQNKFWEMHELLFANQLQLSLEKWVSFAEQLQLNIDKFKADLQSEEIANIIKEDFHTGVRSGVNGTPCFYINGKRYDGDASYEKLKQALQANSTYPT